MNELALVPKDPRIPALAAFARMGLDPALNRAGIRGSFHDARVVRYVPGSRLTLRADRAAGPVAIKAYAKPLARTVAALEALASAGFASGRSPTAAPLLGFDASLRFTVTSWFDAPSGWDLLESGNGHRAGELGAYWLVATHSAGITTEMAYGPTEVLDQARRWASHISNSHPSLQPKASRFVRRLGADMPDPGDNPGLRHGAFGLKHLFDLGDGPGVIDWDSPKYGVVEVDAAMFLAKLCNYAIRSPELASEACRASDVLRTGISEIVDPTDLLWYEAASCLKCATYRSSRRPERSKRDVNALLDRAATALDERS